MMAESSAPSTSEHRVSLDGSINTSRRGNVPNLEGICVSAIAANFDRFSAAFKMRNSTISPNYIEFLARRFSEALFNIMKCDRTLKPEHFDFLINPHFKELDLVGIDVDLLPALSHKLKKGNNVLSCKAKEPYGFNNIACIVSSLKNMECLECETFNVPLLKAVGNSCPFLKVLKCGLPDSCHWEDGYIDSVCNILRQCRFLEVLEVVDTIGALYKIHKAKWFFMRIKKGYFKLKGYTLKALFSQNVSLGYSLCDALELCAVVCPCTTSLHLDFLNSQKELESCLKFPYLENITFEKMSGNVSFDSLCLILSLTDKKILSLDIPFLPGIDISHLVECCPWLQSLSLLSRDTGKPRLASTKKFYSLANLRFLTTLKIENIDFKIQENVAALKLILHPHSGIKKLSLIKCTGLTEEFFENLDLLHIEELDVSHTDASTSTLEKLLLNENLRKLKKNKYSYIQIFTELFSRHRSRDIMHPLDGFWNRMRCSMSVRR